MTAGLGRKTLQTYEWFEFLIIFLCSSYCYDFLNFCISYLFRPTRFSYYSSKLSNVWRKPDFSNLAKLSGSCGIFAAARFLLNLEKCRIQAGAEIRYSATSHFGGSLHSQSLNWYCQKLNSRPTKIHKLNTTQKCKQRKIHQNKTTLTSLDQETRWVYSTMPPSPCGGPEHQKIHSIRDLRKYGNATASQIHWHLATHMVMMHLLHRVPGSLGQVNLGLDWIEQCFTALPTQYRLYGRRFLQVKRPNQQYQSTERESTKEKTQTTQKDTNI